MPLNQHSSNSIQEASTAGDGASDGTGMYLPALSLGRSLSDFITEGIIQLDPWLSPFKDALRKRFTKAQEWLAIINEHEGGLDKFSKV